MPIPMVISMAAAPTAAATTLFLAGYAARRIGPVDIYVPSSRDRRCRGLGSCICRRDPPRTISATTYGLRCGVDRFGFADGCARAFTVRK